MSDDLVKRLRNGDTVMANHYMDEAADRIEKALEALESIAGKVPYADDPWDIAAAALLELQGETNDK